MICNSKSGLTLVPRCAYSIGNDEQCQIRVVSSSYEGVNAVVQVHEEGHAIFQHIHRQPPVYVNGTLLKHKCLLLPDDTLTVLGKNFVYKNSVLTADDLRERMADSNASCEPFQMKTPRPRRLSLVVLPRSTPKLVSQTPKNTPKQFLSTRKYTPQSIAKTPKNTPKSTLKKTPKPCCSLSFKQSPVDATLPSSTETSLSSKKRKSTTVASPSSAKRPKSRQDEWLVEEMSSPVVAKNLSLLAVSPSGIDHTKASSARSSLRTSLLQRSVNKKFITSRRSRADFEDWRNVSDISLAESASMEVQTSGVQEWESILDEGSEGGESNITLQKCLIKLKLWNTISCHCLWRKC